MFDMNFLNFKILSTSPRKTDFESLQEVLGNCEIYLKLNKANFLSHTF